MFFCLSRKTIIDNLNRRQRQRLKRLGQNFTILIEQDIISQTYPYETDLARLQGCIKSAAYLAKMPDKIFSVARGIDMDLIQINIISPQGFKRIMKFLLNSPAIPPRRHFSLANSMAEFCCNNKSLTVLPERIPYQAFGGMIEITLTRINKIDTQLPRAREHDLDFRFAEKNAASPAPLMGLYANHGNRNPRFPQYAVLHIHPIELPLSNHH
ncbi:MAG: hypothetical protein Greene071436_319 [Parcubacteria group bacterium Greene0714_36]|nr:MAG: hypothetical protein Greene071436_319 [Parcubacteria group bacterium Greene0714_36]